MLVTKKQIIRSFIAAIMTTVLVCTNISVGHAKPQTAIVSPENRIELKKAVSITLSPAPEEAAEEVQVEEPTEPVAEIDTEPVEETVNEYDLYLLSHLVYGEAGAEWCSDAMQQYVASVVLNRVKDERYPNTIEGVIYQKGQYRCTWDGNFNKTPSDRAIANTKYVLLHGSVLPDCVIFQAEFKQGSGAYVKEQNMYFCY